MAEGNEENIVSRIFFRLVLSIRAVALVQGLPALRAIFCLTDARLVRDALATAGANVVLHTFYCISENLFFLKISPKG